MQPVRAEIHLSIIQVSLLGAISLEIQTKVNEVDKEAIKSNTTVASDQLFLRIQEHLDRQLRIACSKMEDQLRKQRASKEFRR